MPWFLTLTKEISFVSVFPIQISFGDIKPIQNGGKGVNPAISFSPVTSLNVGHYCEV